MSYRILILEMLLKIDDLDRTVSMDKLLELQETIK